MPSEIVSCRQVSVALSSEVWGVDHCSGHVRGLHNGRYGNQSISLGPLRGPTTFQATFASWREKI